MKRSASLERSLFLSLFAAALFLRGNVIEPDLWGHLQFGLQVLRGHGLPRVDLYSWTAAGAPWVDHEWLTQILFASLHLLGGNLGLVLFKAAFFVPFALVYRRLLADVAPNSQALAVVFCLGLAGAAELFGFRPQIVTYLFLVLELRALEDLLARSNRRAYALPLLFAAWANMHGGFVIGLLVLALYAGAQALAGVRDAAARARGARLALLLAACAAATFLNPYGLGLWSSVLTSMRNPHTYRFLAEWQPFSARLSSPLLALGLVYLILACGVLYAHGARMRPVDIGLLAGGAALLLAARRNVPIAWILGGAPLAAQESLLSAGLAAASRTLGRRGVRGALGILSLLCAAGLWPLRGRLRLRYPASGFPAGAVAFIQDNQLQGNLWNPFNDGQYLIYHLQDRLVRVSMDFRYDAVYPEAAYMRNFLFYLGQLGPREAFAGETPDFVLLKRGDVFTRPLLDGGWKLLYSDASYALLGREAPAAPKPARALPGWLPFP
ncbi:MAG TPA: hypothetical protein VNI01_15410 [Elusimicrobiota bacterium]|jgi:hypothetical protein|nr:hypothetical protein [Elusimicrobiota bacterium]